MKKIFIAIGAALVVVVGAALLLPLLIPSEKIRQEIAEQVKAVTGRDLIIEGGISASVIPSPSLSMTNVVISSPGGFHSKDFLRIGSLKLKLKLMPLLSGKVEIGSFILTDPVVTLEVDSQGKNNWTFEPASAGSSPETAASLLSNVVLSALRVENGKVSYRHEPWHWQQDIEAIALSATLKSIDSPMTGGGSALYRGKAVKLDFTINKPRALTGASGPTALIAALNTDVLGVDFKGDVTGGKTPSLQGDLTLLTPSVRDTLQWLTGRAPEGPRTLWGPLSLSGKLTGGGEKITLSQFALAVDAIKVSGEMGLENGGVRPKLKSSLAIQALDLNPYLPFVQSTTPPSSPPSGWSEAPLDVSLLKQADAEIRIALEGLSVQPFEIGKTILSAQVSNARLSAELGEMAIYGGQLKGKLAVDGGVTGGVTASASLSAKGLALLEVWKDLLEGKNLLSGALTADLQLSAKGKSERALVGSLAGKGKFVLSDGTIKGIDLGQMIHNTPSAFTVTPDSSAKTDFAELGGSVLITDGVVSNKDLALKSPLLRLEGAGTVSLLSHAVAYRIKPKVVPASEGQGDPTAMPVIVEGGWESLTYRPDTAGAAKGRGAVQGVQDSMSSGRLPVVPPGRRR